MTILKVNWTGPQPYGEEGSLFVDTVNLFQGAVTTTGFTVVAKMAETCSAFLVVYSNQERTLRVKSSELTSTDEALILRTSVDGLSPDTQYYWAIESGGVKASIQGKTKTFPSGAASFKILASSCAKGSLGENGAVGSDVAVSNKSVFEHMRTAHSDALAFIHMGDLHYRNISTNNISLFHGAYDDVLRQSNQQNLYKDMPIVYMYDDHDYGPNDSSSTSASRPAAIAAYKSRVPHYPLVFNGPTDPVAHTFVIGRVRFINLDQRSQRVDGSTMLGSAQKQWLKDTLLAATEPVICLQVGVPWIATDAQNGWNAAPSERTELLAFFQANDLIDRIFMIHGDNHMVGIDNGINSGGFPVFLFASLESGSADKGGPYSEGTDRDAGGGQYGTIEITDHGYNEITVKGTAYRWKSSALSQLLTYSKTYAAPGDPAPEPDPLPTLLPGFERLALPSSHYSDNGDGTYTTTQIDIDALLDKKLVGDGSIAVQYVETVTNELKIYLMDNYSTDSNNRYYNIRFDGTQKTLRVRDGWNQDHDYTADFQPGDFFILNRIEGVYSVQRSREGVITDITRHGVKQMAYTIQYLKIASEGIVNHLQVKGFVDL